MRDINLLKPFVLSPEIVDFRSYREKLIGEEKSTLDYFNSSEVHWTVSEGLCKKVTPEGTFKPFFGDTLVFPLSNSWQKTLTPIIEELSLLKFMANKLAPETMHITLHDLSNGNDLSSLKQKLQDNQKIVRDIFRELQTAEKGIIEFELREILPCVNTSCVLNLIPNSERDYNILMNLYRLFDEVVTLPYFLRPHITLGYFRPSPLSSKDIFRLMEIQKKFFALKGRTLEIDIQTLVYQTFTDMNNYVDHTT